MLLTCSLKYHSKKESYTKGSFNIESSLLIESEIKEKFLNIRELFKFRNRGRGKE